RARELAGEVFGGGKNRAVRPGSGSAVTAARRGLWLHFAGGHAGFEAADHVRGLGRSAGVCGGGRHRPRGGAHRRGAGGSHGPVVGESRGGGGDGAGRTRALRGHGDLVGEGNRPLGETGSQVVVKIPL